MTETREFYSLPEFAAILGITRIAVFKKVRKGKIKAIRIGRNWAIPASETFPRQILHLASNEASIKPAKPKKQKTHPTPSLDREIPPLSDKTDKNTMKAPSPPQSADNSLDSMGWD